MFAPVFALALSAAPLAAMLMASAAASPPGAEVVAVALAVLAALAALVAVALRRRLAQSARAVLFGGALAAADWAQQAACGARALALRVPLLGAALTARARARLPPWQRELFATCHEPAAGARALWADGELGRAAPRMRVPVYYGLHRDVYCAWRAPAGARASAAVAAFRAAVIAGAASNAARAVVLGEVWRPA